MCLFRGRAQHHLNRLPTRIDQHRQYNCYENGTPCLLGWGLLGFIRCSGHCAFLARRAGESRVRISAGVALNGRSPSGIGREPLRSRAQRLAEHSHSVCRNGPVRGTYARPLRLEWSPADAFASGAPASGEVLPSEKRDLPPELQRHVLGLRQAVKNSSEHPHSPTTNPPPSLGKACDSGGFMLYCSGCGGVGFRRHAPNSLATERDGRRQLGRAKLALLKASEWRPARSYPVPQPLTGSYSALQSRQVREVPHVGHWYGPNSRLRSSRINPIISAAPLMPVLPEPR